MKVLQVISSGGLYGAEAVLLTLSKTLNQASHRSTLAVFNNLPNPNLQVHEKALQSGLESHLIPCSGQFDYKAVSNLRKFIEVTGADVVHAHGYKADSYVYLALRGSGIPIVSTCHNWIKHSWLVSAYGALDRLVLRSYSAVVAVSEEVKQILLGSGVNSENIHLIRNGIDVASFANVPASLREHDNSRMIGWIGRLSHEKGPDIFIRAAALALTDNPSLLFILVGDGPLRADLETLTQELGISTSIRFVGRREDMAAVYASMDLLVSSSRQEGLPMAILEGMASGVPWVATAVGDVPRLIKDGQNGLLVPAGDIEGLASGILRLAGHHDICKQLGMAARQTVQEDYSTERMTKEYINLYEQLIAPSRVSPRAERETFFGSGRPER
jgi:glycosyltransferase involved in cell wall biosynthesis